MIEDKWADFQVTKLNSKLSLSVNKLHYLYSHQQSQIEP